MHAGVRTLSAALLISTLLAGCSGHSAAAKPEAGTPGGTGSPAAPTPSQDRPSGTPTAGVAPGGGASTAAGQAGGGPAAVPQEHLVTAESIGLHWTGGTPYPAAHVGSLRLWDTGTTWSRVEQKAPVGGRHSYDWSGTDRIIRAALAGGARPLVVLSAPPTWASTRPTEPGLEGVGTAAPPALDAWRTYVRATAKHLQTAFGGNVREFQIWDEANIRGFFSGTPAEMASLTSAAAEELRAVIPDAVVVAPSVAGRQPNAVAWLEAFLSAGGADHVDAVALHLYPPKGGTPLVGIGLFQAFQRVLDAHGVHLPVWDTEVNYGGKADGTFYDEVTGASWLVQTYVLAASAGIARTYWYAWDNVQWPGVRTVGSDRRTPLAPGRALAALSARLVGKHIGPCQPADGVVRCPVDGAGATVLWATGPAVAWPMHGGSAQPLDGSQPRPAPGGAVMLDGMPTIVTAGSSD